MAVASAPPSFAAQLNAALYRVALSRVLKLDSTAALAEESNSTADAFASAAGTLVPDGANFAGTPLAGSGTPLERAEAALHAIIRLLPLPPLRATCLRNEVSRVQSFVPIVGYGFLSSHASMYGPLSGFVRYVSSGGLRRFVSSGTSLSTLVENGIFSPPEIGKPPLWQPWPFSFVNFLVDTGTSRTSTRVFDEVRV